MELFVDDVAVNQQPDAGELLEDTLRQVQDDVLEPGRMVVAVRCDGKDVPGGELPRVLKHLTCEYEQIEVFTGTRGELVSDAMTEAAESLRQTQNACSEIADRINEGQVREAIASLSECITAWQQIHDAVGKSMEMLAISAESITIREEPLIDIIRKPADVLVQIKQALQAQDYVLLSDILQYEFAEVINQWQMIVTRLHEEAKSQSTDTQTSSGSDARP